MPSSPLVGYQRREIASVTEATHWLTAKPKSTSTQIHRHAANSILLKALTPSLWWPRPSL